MRAHPGRRRQPVRHPAWWRMHRPRRAHVEHWGARAASQLVMLHRSSEAAPRRITWRDACSTSAHANSSELLLCHWHGAVRLDGASANDAPRADAARARVLRRLGRALVGTRHGHARGSDDTDQQRGGRYGTSDGGRPIERGCGCRRARRRARIAIRRARVFPRPRRYRWGAAVRWVVCVGAEQRRLRRTFLRGTTALGFDERFFVGRRPSASRRASLRPGSRLPACRRIASRKRRKRHPRRSSSERRSPWLPRPAAVR